MIINPYRYSSGATGIKVGLQSWWGLEESSGNRADAHGTRTLIPSGTVGSVAARVGNGSNSSASGYLQTNAGVTPSPSIAASDFTIAGVFKTSASNYGVISRNGALAGSQRQFLVTVESGVLYFAVSVGGATNSAVVGVGSGLNDGNLHDFIAWRDTAANTINIQLDGGTPASVSFSGASTLYTAVDPGITLHGIGSGTYVAGGVADETGIWGRMLTSTERTALRNGGAWRNYAGLAGI
jgi:hypothetical protein